MTDINGIFSFCEAVGTAAFAVSGAMVAVDRGTDIFGVLLMAVFTALGGGLVRDMLLNDVPMIIRDKHLYAVPSAVGCVLTVFVCRGVQWKMLDFTAEVVLDCAIVVLVVVMRLLSVKFSIMLPGAVKRHNTYLPSESRYLKRPVIHPDAHDGGDDDKDQSRA